MRTGDASEVALEEGDAIEAGAGPGADACVSRSLVCEMACKTHHKLMTVIGVDKVDKAYSATLLHSRTLLGSVCLRRWRGGPSW